MQNLASCKLGESIVAEIDHSIKHFNRTAILVHVAFQNTLDVRAAITEYVAKIDNWSVVDPSSYSAFDTAVQTLFLKHGIFIRVLQKANYNPDYPFDEIDSSGFNKVYIDHAQNADPHYTDVSS